MLDFIQNLTFLRPYMFWLIPLVLIVMHFFNPHKETSSSWKKVCAPKFLNYLLSGSQNANRKSSKFLIYAALLSAILALAGPSFDTQTQPALIQQNPVMILLDLSSDMTRTDIRPSRLERAKIEIADILKQAKVAPSGLIVYTAEPFLISPLSEDANIIINLLNAVTSDIMPVGGHRPDRAIDLAVERLKTAGFASGNILIFSGSLPEDILSQTQDAAKEAIKSGFRVSVYDFSAAFSKTLADVAKAGGGIDINITQNQNEPLIRLLQSSSKGDITESANVLETPTDDGWIFVFIPMFLMLFLFKKGALSVAVLLFGMSTAQAGFLFNADQEGAIEFARAQYDKAAQKFENQKWKASALYKAGDYQQAVSIFDKQNDIESLYNKGNALAKGGDIDAAIETYEQVLAKDSTHEDAKFNLEYLKKLKQDQQQQNQKNKNENNQQNQQNQSSNTPNENGQTGNQNEQNKPSETSDKPNDNSDQSAQAEKSVGDENDQSPSQNADTPNDNKNQNNEHDKSLEHEQAPVSAGIEQKADSYDENVQAREQQFRDIPEDTGGLLKAFIKQEYLKKRYED